MATKLYTLHYRRGFKGATQGFIEASSQENAEALGQQYCATEIGRKYIRVEPAVLATEDDLPEVKKPEAPKSAVPDKKTA